MRFNDNHSTGYSMIGYTCAYLRYYYPVEFVTAYLQNAGNDNDTIQGTNLAKQLGITISPIKFRHSGVKYTCDSDAKIIYKPVSSLKGFGSDTARKLYALKDNQYANFIEYLEDNPCGKYTEKLITLNFFSEFGKTQTLLDIYTLYEKYGGRKQLNKADAPLDEQVMLKYATATEKQYKIFDGKGFMLELCKDIPDREIPILTQLKAQTEFLGYLDYKNPEMAHMGCVLSINKKFSPKLTIYKLDTGETEVVKMRSDDYGVSGIGENTVIKYLTTMRNKSQKVDGKWVKLVDEYEPWIKNFKIIENMS